MRADDWIEVLAGLRSGRAAAQGRSPTVQPDWSRAAAVVAGHGGWSWPGSVLTAFGWLLVVKGSVFFLATDLALAWMRKAPSRAGFVVGGLVLLAVGSWAGYCLVHGGQRA